MTCSGGQVMRDDAQQHPQPKRQEKERRTIRVGRQILDDDVNRVAIAHAHKLLARHRLRLHRALRKVHHWLRKLYWVRMSKYEEQLFSDSGRLDGHF